MDVHLVGVGFDDCPPCALVLFSIPLVKLVGLWAASVHEAHAVNLEQLEHAVHLAHEER